jgi:hypothetical protein
MASWEFLIWNAQQTQRPIPDIPTYIVRKLWPYIASGSSSAPPLTPDSDATSYRSDSLAVHKMLMLSEIHNGEPRTSRGWEQWEFCGSSCPRKPSAQDELGGQAERSPRRPETQPARFLRRAQCLGCGRERVESKISSNHVIAANL